MQPRACLHICVLLCICIYMYICIFVYLYICVNVCICIYVYLYICIFVDVYIYIHMRISYICSSFSISPGKTKNHFKHILVPLQKPIVTNYQYLAELEKFVNYTRLSKNIMDCVVVGTDVQVPRIIEEP